MTRKNTKNDYLRRINRVIDHISAYPGKKLSIENLSQIACLSPFHFHRIFKALTGEPLASFARRLRLERAALLLKSSPNRSLTEVALHCGFSSSSDFSRAFKKHFGKAPSQWNRKAPLENSKNCQVLTGLPYYSTEQLARESLQVKLRDFTACRVVFVRISGAYEPEKFIAGYQRFLDFTKRHALSLSKGRLIGMSQDDPAITPYDKYRYDFCAILDKDVPLEEGIGMRALPACRVASIRCKGKIDVVDRVWRYLFDYWLPRSMYQPADLPAMEIYLQTPEEIGWNTFHLEACLPVTSL